MEVGKHLVFYDGECGLCDQAVQFLLKADKRKIYVFAPLQGQLAKKLLVDLPVEMKTADSMILVEDYKSEARQYFVFGKAALRICWLLGGFWSVLGLLSFFPGFLYNWLYRIVARNRLAWFEQTCSLPDEENKDRFLA